MTLNFSASGIGSNVSNVYDNIGIDSLTGDTGARSDSSDESMIINGLDFNYLGVYDIWNNDLGRVFPSLLIMRFANFLQVKVMTAGTSVQAATSLHLSAKVLSILSGSN